MVCCRRVNIVRAELEKSASAGTGPLDVSRNGEATREFEAYLRGRIVGQDAAIEAEAEVQKAS